MKVLVAGGAGFIGSTVASYLLDEGHTPVLLDSLVTGAEAFTSGRIFYRGDIADGGLIDRVFAEHPDIDAVLHCAALIVVPESVADPLGYYQANVAAGLAFCGHLLRNGCRRLVFSSSAAVYATTDDGVVDENTPLDPQSPYARTKAVFETALADIAAGTTLQVLSLRYFNPIGADPRLRTGLQVPDPSHALGRMLRADREGTAFAVTGVDWPTRDGTGLRDYVHVWDLARAHVRALERFDAAVAAAGSEGYAVIDLGTGTGTTVRELIAALEAVTGRPLAVVETDRRPGDVAGGRPRATRAQDLLDWHPEFTVSDGIRDTLRWFAVRDAILDY